MINFATKECFARAKKYTADRQMPFLQHSLVQIIVELFRVVLPYDVTVRSDRVAFVLPEIVHRRHDADFRSELHFRFQSTATRIVNYWRLNTSLPWRWHCSHCAPQRIFLPATHSCSSCPQVAFRSTYDNHCGLYRVYFSCMFSRIYDTPFYELS